MMPETLDRETALEKAKAVARAAQDGVEPWLAKESYMSFRFQPPSLTGRKAAPARPSWGRCSLFRGWHSLEYYCPAEWSPTIVARRSSHSQE